MMRPLEDDMRRTRLAKQYGGEFVALNKHGTVIDTDLSPSALKERVKPGTRILFIPMPPDTYDF